MDIRKILNQSFKMEFEKNGKSHHHDIYKKAKRIRSAFTTDQIMYLEKEFIRSPYIGVVSRKEIANTLNIPERAVKVWFQNRRMKEKKDVTQRSTTEYHHYGKTGHNGRSVNDQLSNADSLQSNNNLCAHSVLPQTKSTTSLNESTVDDFLTKNRKQVPNITTNNVEIRKTTDDVIVSHNFQNNTITSSTNEAKRNAELSIELLKKYKNHFHTNAVKKTIKSKATLEARQSDAKKRKLNEQTMDRRDKSHSSAPAPSSTKCQQTHTQIPSGYVSLYPQLQNQQYSSPGNFLWKPVAPAEMSTFMPMCDIAILSNAQTMNPPVSKPNSVQKNQCSCNCHMNPQSNTIAFAHQNQMPQPQYVIAMPFHKTPVQFRSPI